MPLTTFEIIRWIVTIILTIFHCFVTYFIFSMRYKKKNKSYKSLFYLFYLMLSAADIITIINSFFASKFLNIDAFKPWLFEHPMYNTLLWLMSGYLIYFLSMLHVAISMNRAWVAFLFSIKNLSTVRILKKLVWGLPLLPLSILSVRFWGTTKNIYTDNGDIIGVYIEPFIKSYHTIAGTTVVMSTGLLTFILTTITILRYHYLFRQYQEFSEAMKKDIVLFCQAIVTLGFQLAFVAYYIMQIIGTANNFSDFLYFCSIYFRYVNDISSLNNPISLILVCKFIREDFIFFYFGWKKENVVVISSGQLR